MNIKGAKLPGSRFRRHDLPLADHRIEDGQEHVLGWRAIEVGLGYAVANQHPRCQRRFTVSPSVAVVGLLSGQRAKVGVHVSSILVFRPIEIKSGLARRSTSP